MAAKRLPKEKFDEIYALVPRLCVEVVIKTPEGVILSKRRIEPYKGYWHLPGGTVVFGETLDEAVKRVATEEIGLEVEIDKFLGFIHYPHETEKGSVNRWTIGAAFQTYVVGGKIEGDDQSDEVRVFKEIPPQTIKEQAAFLEKHLGLVGAPAD